MARENIKDKYGRIIGFIEEQGNRYVAKSVRGKMLGFYEKNMNITKDLYGRKVAEGNILAALIYNEANLV